MGKHKSRRSLAPATLSKETLQSPSIARLGGISKESAVSRGKRKRSEKRARVDAKHAFIDAELQRLEADAALRRAALSAKMPKAAPGPALAYMAQLGEGLDAAVGDRGKGEGEASDVNGKEKSGRPAQKIVHEKQRRKILVQEAVQVNNVIEHPSYQANPMEALRQHLMNSVKEDPLVVPAGPQAKTARKDRKARKRQQSEAARPAVSSRKTTQSAEVSARRREQKSELAAKARKGRVEKAKRMSSPRGRIGEKRPKII